MCPYGHFESQSPSWRTDVCCWLTYLDTMPCIVHLVDNVLLEMAASIILPELKNVWYSRTAPACLVLDRKCAVVCKLISFCLRIGIPDFEIVIFESDILSVPTLNDRPFPNHTLAENFQAAMSFSPILTHPKSHEKKGKPRPQQ